MIFNKIKIISLNKLIIFSFAFLFILFFEINVAQAAQTCSWLYTKTGIPTNTCGRLNIGTQSENPETKCANATRPSKCTSAAVQSEDCVCCCKEAAATLNDTMPKFKIPDIKLQISIPGLSLTKGADILANCQKDAKGNPIKCTFPWISEYVAGIYKYAIGIVGILAAVVLMIGGVMWIVAGGSATMIGEAKAWIGASLTGLVIALCSYVILYQVNPALLNFKGLDIQIVKEFKIDETILSYTGLTGGYGTPGTALDYNGTNWDSMINTIASQNGIDPALLKAVMATESAGNPNAVSPAGAQGLMQLMPKTAQWLRVSNPFDATQSLTGGAVYLKSLLKTYNGNIESTLAAYNWGPGNLQRNGLNNAPTETRNYLNKVIGYYNKFKSS